MKLEGVRPVPSSTSGSMPMDEGPSPKFKAGQSVLYQGRTCQVLAQLWITSAIPRGARFYKLSGLEHRGWLHEDAIRLMRINEEKTDEKPV